ncbi:MAG: hypothetical protein NXI01_06085 [Gammaproteobacteria bacterium]|nr:hypothetical protein [Gammaproteobacteria bacterium]
MSKKTEGSAWAHEGSEINHHEDWVGHIENSMAYSDVVIDLDDGMQTWSGSEA